MTSAPQLEARAESALDRCEDALSSHSFATLASRRELVAEIAGLRRAMESRPVIEQAKGIIIATTGCDPDHAFDALSCRSQDENRKLVLVAADLVRASVHDTI